MLKKLSKVSTLAIASLLITACGSSGGDSGTTQPPIVVNPTVTENHIVYSNESLDITKTESTGTLNPYTNSKLMKSINKSINKPTRINPNFSWINKENSKFSKNITPKAAIPTLNSTEIFKTKNMQTDIFENTNFTLKAIGSKCLVWVETTDNLITNDKAKQLANEFDSNIYNFITTNFASHYDVNNDGKVAILIFDIKDGFDGVNNFSYTGGYYNSVDTSTTNPDSNQMDVVYLDSYPSMSERNGDGSLKPDTRNTLYAASTLVHEFQHMVNFHDYWTNNNKPNGAFQPIWMNEGLSMAAEHMYANTKYPNSQIDSRVDYFNRDEKNSIKNGKSILDWEFDNDVLGNYALSYLFLQYVKAQTTNQDTIYKEILTGAKNDNSNVDNVLKKYGSSENNSLAKALTNFRIATLLNKPTGVYGFKGNITGINAPLNVSTSSAIDLKGGGAIIRTNTNSDPGFKPVGEGSNIKIVGVQK